MKPWKCSACGAQIEVYDEYEPQMCCAGRMGDACGCMGEPINPVFCDECEERLFGNKPGS